MADAIIDYDFFARHSDKIRMTGPSECWMWTGSRDGCGYGKAYHDGKPRLAHRLAYSYAHGRFPAKGLVVRHRCDVPSCVNPDHLELGTQADNIHDMDRRERRGALKGESNKWAKLTDDDVRAIRKMYVRGSSDYGQPAIARLFGLTQGTVGKVITRRSWSHVA